MTGSAARFASAMLLASLLPITANAVPVAAVIDAAGSTGPLMLIKQIAEHASPGERLPVLQRDSHVAAEETMLGVKTGDRFDRAVGGALQAQIKR